MMLQHESAVEQVLKLSDDKRDTISCVHSHGTRSADENTTMVLDCRPTVFRLQSATRFNANYELYGVS